MAVGYYRKHWHALTRFIGDGAVPIDNSPTEREFQSVAKLRLNMLFAGSSEGAHRACVLLGIVATCRAIGVPVQSYLTWAFVRLGTHREHFGLPLEAMTPAAFKTARGCRPHRTQRIEPAGCHPGVADRSRRFDHDHVFEPDGHGGTVMRAVFDFDAPRLPLATAAFAAFTMRSFSDAENERLVFGATLSTDAPLTPRSGRLRSVSGSSSRPGTGDDLQRGSHALSVMDNRSA